MPGKLFPLGGPVSENDIVDRVDFLNSLEIRLAEGHSVMLAGPRRIGKTSLALEVLRRLKEQEIYVGSVDLFRMPSKRDLALSIINACLENRTGLKKTTTAVKDSLKAIAGSAKLVFKMKDIEIDFNLLNKEQDDNKLLHYALDLPEKLAKQDNKHLVMVFDEFQEASKIADENIYKIMRSYFQLHQNVSYLFLGSKEGLMKTIFCDNKQAFYRFATILPIPAIPDSSWVEYITDKFQQRQIKVSDKHIKEIIKLSGGHPQDTMLLCSEIYYSLLEANEKTLSLDAIKIGYDRALFALASLFDEILDESGGNQQIKKVLKRIASKTHVYSEKEHPSEVKRAIDLLIVKGIIEKTGRGSYKFIEPMFQEYILRELS